MAKGADVRNGVVVIGLALTAWGGHADAGVTATYALPDGRQTMVIETGGNGNFRMTLGQGCAGFLFRDGRSFLISDEDGDVQVVPMDDLQTAAGRVSPSPRSVASFRSDVSAENRRLLTMVVTGISRIGQRTVAGQPGKVHRITMTVGGKPATDTIVASDAPALAPLHAAWQRMTDAAQAVFRTPVVVAAAPDIHRISAFLGQLIALGAPLDVQGLATLRTVRFDTVPPPDRFELPAVPLGLPEIEEMIRTAGEDAAE